MSAPVFPDNEPKKYFDIGNPVDPVIRITDKRFEVINRKQQKYFLTLQFN